MKTIAIKGDIVDNNYGRFYDWIGWDYTSPEKIENELKLANGDDVVFLINSPGGSVFDGYDIFNAIKDYKGKTTAKIVGLAASAASFIAMAADNVQACALSQMMIHRASNANRGNAPSHHANGSFLEGIDSTIVKAYTMRNGKTDEEMIELMDKTTWLTPEQALENGIVDEIVNDSVEKPVIVNSFESDRISIVKQLFDNDNIENIKRILLENQNDLKGVINSSKLDNEQEENKMTLEDFKKDHSEIYNQVVKEATNNERKRIAAINDLRGMTTEDKINEAIENGIAANDFAYNVMIEQKKADNKIFKSIQDDATDSGVNDVPVAESPKDRDAEEKANLLNKAKEMLNRGGKR